MGTAFRGGDQGPLCQVRPGQEGHHLKHHTPGDETLLGITGCERGQELSYEKSSPHDGTAVLSECVTVDLVGVG